MNKLLKSVGITAAALFAGTASAHTGHDTVHGLVSGFSHPFFGPDHLVAMLALGFAATQLKSRLGVILAFTLGMAAGGVLSWGGVVIPYAEQLILASLATLGCLLFIRQTSLKSLIALPVIALFASAHGWAHVAEQPVSADTAGYMAGMLTAAVILQIAGLLLSQALRQHLIARRAAGGAALTTATLGVASMMMG